MPLNSTAATATATAVVTSQVRNRITGASVTGGVTGAPAGSAQPQGLDDLVLGVGQVLHEEGVGRVDVVAIQQPDQRGVRVRLVVRVAPDPVDLGQGQLELDDEV